MEKLVSLSRDVMVGARMCRILPVNLSLGLFDRYKAVVNTGEPLVYEFPIDDRNVNSSWLRVQAVKLSDGIAITASDITSRKKNEERILRLAQHDTLTGLPNRSLLLDRIEQAIERANRYRQLVAVFVIDVDDFKQINDTYGHAAGDQALLAVAQRLTSKVRATDSVIRVGGDEFIVIMPDVSALDDIRTYGAAMVKRMRPTIALDGHPVNVTISMGAAVYPLAASSAKSMLTVADAAMYAAKRRGKNQFEVTAG